MFGLNEAVLSFIRRQVGLRDDPPDANGSLHAKVGNLLSKPIINNGTVIKSIQRGTIAMDSSETSKDAAIASVVQAKTMLNLLGTSGTYQVITQPNPIGGQMTMGVSNHASFAQITLLNATTIRASRTGSGVIGVRYQVVEFY